MSFAKYKYEPEGCSFCGDIYSKGPRIIRDRETGVIYCPECNTVFVLKDQDKIETENE